MEGAVPWFSGLYCLILNDHRATLSQLKRTRSLIKKLPHITLSLNFLQPFLQSLPLELNPF